MSAVRPAVLFLLILALIGALAIPCCCSSVRRRDIRNDGGGGGGGGSLSQNSLVMGTDSVVIRPNRPKIFTSPEELRGYLERLSDYYAVAGRPRFGKRAPSSYETINYRPREQQIIDLIDSSQLMED